MTSYTKEHVTLNKNDIMVLYNEFLDMVSFIIKIIILFLSITKALKVSLISFIIAVMLQLGYNFDVTKSFLHTLLYNYNYNWVDIALTIITAAISFTIIAIFKLISDKIDKNFEELNNTIKQKDIMIEKLNKKLLSKTV